MDPTSVHAANLEALHGAQITAGCTQEPLQYCPNNPVTRAQMASFLARALDLQAPPRQAGFVDVDPTSVHRRQPRSAPRGTDNRRLHPGAASVLPQQTHHASADGCIPVPGPATSSPPPAPPPQTKPPPCVEENPSETSEWYPDSVRTMIEGPHRHRVSGLLNGSSMLLWLSSR